MKHPMIKIAETMKLKPGDHVITSVGIGIVEDAKDPAYLVCRTERGTKFCVGRLKVELATERGEL